MGRLAGVIWEYGVAVRCGIVAELTTAGSLPVKLEFAGVKFLGDYEIPKSRAPDCLCGIDDRVAGTA